MKKTVKPLGLITILLIIFNHSPAQIKLPSVNGIGNDIKRVVSDYTNHFTGLMGDVIAENPQSTEYECNFKVNGAEESSVTKYTASKNMVCSWQAVMLTTESFEKAKQKYKSLFNQVNNLQVNCDNNKFHLKGKYEAPSGEKKFFSIILVADTEDEAIKKMKVEILMQYNEPMEWKVKVLVYEQEKEDGER